LETSRRKLKTWYFILEGLNSFATVYYCYYLYFYMAKVFGFGNRANLTLAALNGFICIFAAWWGGRFAQRFGNFTALKLGFFTMGAALTCGIFVQSMTGQILVMAAMLIGMCFTWPTLEAMASEGESSVGIQKMVGIYNVIWAGTGALADFTGGMMLDKLGLRSIFYVPAIIFFVQLVITFWLAARAGLCSVPESLADDRGETPHPDPLPIGCGEGEDSVAHGRSSNSGSPYEPVARALCQSNAETETQSESRAAPELNPQPIAKAKWFLRMAWLANPFAYIALNTVIAVVPGVANRLGLSATLAGFCCSVWCFARFAAFFGLWAWSGWHYRFRWLLTAYVALLTTFALIAMAPNLAVLVTAQIVFGGALGLIYYSSLFYSMDLSETKSEHGGIHEAAIGLGNFAGPAVAAGSLYFLPQIANSGVIGVCGLLLAGLSALILMRGSMGLRR
jgi:predicted MFS family arabinose efflux permease